ncbi:DNA recombination protein RmuC [Candidatus Bodocaedibacter vickermanii]|uniref:DNA recombination protein RmuC homolog n=2 Tax=Candidatus Bodocaedibacter vickermanii TaxID=2741701 RepID=A0A7L9RU72_9PROT|nr:DNA recombination protein RmuC [Candidatus Paracaedibacteraceae bacterium 'Lake Konstanz']
MPLLFITLNYTQQLYKIKMSLELIILIVGAITAVIAFIFQQRKYESLQYRYMETDSQRRELGVMLERERLAFEEKLRYMENMHRQFSDQFKALSADALKMNNQSFLQLAKESLGAFHQHAQTDLTHRQKSIQEMIQPLHTTLKDVDVKIQELEKSRVGAYEGLKQHLSSMLESQKALQTETSNLVKALRAPTVRGQWGEMQLRRVVEMAGMLSHCDFMEQVNVVGEERRYRPDMVVNLPGGKKIVVDAKAPLSAYLDALDAPDEEQKKEFVKQHARQIRQHIKQLSSKSYWDQLGLQPAPEFVVLFLPGEVFFSAALEQDPGLIEAGVEEKVILATPTTLIALLRAVAFGWRQEKMTENAQEISRIGKELYKRLSDMGDHFSKLGRNIHGVVDAYNQSVGTLEKRVLVSARRLKDLDVVSQSEEMADIVVIEKTVRDLNSPEFYTNKTEDDLKDNS